MPTTSAPTTPAPPTLQPSTAPTWNIESYTCDQLADRQSSSTCLAALNFGYCDGGRSRYYRINACNFTCNGCYVAPSAQPSSAPASPTPGPTGVPTAVPTSVPTWSVEGLTCQQLEDVLDFSVCYAALRNGYCVGAGEVDSSYYKNVVYGHFDIVFDHFCWCSPRTMPFVVPVLVGC